MLFDVNKKDDFTKAIDRICKEAVSAIKDGYTFIILSDRGVDEKYASLPALLAIGAVHHHLIEKSIRTQKAKEAAEEKAGQLDRFNKAMVGREIKMKKLEERIAELEAKLGKSET